jgi:hypothetical protein
MQYTGRPNSARRLGAESAGREANELPFVLSRALARPQLYSSNVGRLRLADEILQMKSAAMFGSTTITGTSGFVNMTGNDGDRAGGQLRRQCQHHVRVGSRLQVATPARFRWSLARRSSSDYSARSKCEDASSCEADGTRLASVVNFSTI